MPENVLLYPKQVMGTEGWLSENPESAGCTHKVNLPTSIASAPGLILRAAILDQATRWHHIYQYLFFFTEEEYIWKE